MRRGKGQRGIWPSLTETIWELLKGRNLSLTLACLPWSRPSLQSSRLPPHISRMHPYPLCCPCFHPSISALPLLWLTFSPPRGAGSSRGCTRLPPSSKQILSRVLQELLRGLSFHIRSSPASLMHHYLVLIGDLLPKYPQSLHYRFLIAVSLPRFFEIPLLWGAQSRGILALSSVK